MPQRLSRQERKERTRADLVATAREAFLRHGFHGASLEEIAEHAGYTKGAVYSNFSGKDELFLAVLDAHAARRRRAYVDVALDAPTMEQGLRAIAREMVSGERADPRWVPVLIEFWTHASRDPELRRQVSRRHEQSLDAIGVLLQTLAERHGAGYRVSARDLARGSAAQQIGMELERLIDPEGNDPEVFEELFLGFVLGFTTSRPTPVDDDRSPR
jgi:AcrR family transcriptional regulator